MNELFNQYGPKNPYQNMINQFNEFKNNLKKKL